MTYINASEYQNITGEVVEQQGENVYDFDALSKAATNFIESYCGQTIVADITADKYIIIRRVYDGFVDFKVNMLKEGLEIEKDGVPVADTDYSFGNQAIRSQKYVRYIEVDEPNSVAYTIKGHPGITNEIPSDIKIAAALYIQFIRDKLATQDGLESEGVGALSLRYFENKEGLERVYQLLDQYVVNEII